MPPSPSPSVSSIPPPPPSSQCYFYHKQLPDGNSPLPHGRSFYLAHEQSVGFMSNLAPSWVVDETTGQKSYMETYHGMRVGCSEQAFQMAKCDSAADLVHFQDPNMSGGQIFAAGSREHLPMSPTKKSYWDRTDGGAGSADEAMDEALVTKFMPMPWDSSEVILLKAKNAARLMATDPDILIEDAKGIADPNAQPGSRAPAADSKWGIGADAKGENQLGIKLMLLRKQLQQEYKTWRESDYVKQSIEANSDTPVNAPDSLTDTYQRKKYPYFNEIRKCLELDSPNYEQEYLSKNKHNADIGQAQAHSSGAKEWTKLDAFEKAWHDSAEDGVSSQASSHQLDTLRQAGFPATDFAAVRDKLIWKSKIYGKYIEKVNSERSKNGQEILYISNPKEQEEQQEGLRQVAITVQKLTTALSGFHELLTRDNNVVSYDFEDVAKSGTLDTKVIIKKSNHTAECHLQENPDGTYRTRSDTEEVNIRAAILIAARANPPGTEFDIAVKVQNKDHRLNIICGFLLAAEKLKHQEDFLSSININGDNLVEFMISSLQHLKRLDRKAALEAVEGEIKKFYDSSQFERPDTLAKQIQAAQRNSDPKYDEELGERLRDLKRGGLGNRNAANFADAGAAFQSMGVGAGPATTTPTPAGPGMQTTTPGFLTAARAATKTSNAANASASSSSASTSPDTSSSPSTETTAPSGPQNK